MKAIASEGEDKINRLSRVWVHGSGYEVDDDTLPFLFINGGAATLSTSARGTAILRDTATRRKLQLLEHTGTCYSQSYAAVPNRYISAPRSPHFCYGTSALVLLWDASVLFFLFFFFFLVSWRSMCDARGYTQLEWSEHREEMLYAPAAWQPRVGLLMG